MAYVLSGVGVEISQQAVRPREPSRPAPSITVASPQMATRQARPRSYTAPSNVTDVMIAKVAAYKGQQAQLEKLLKQMGVQLKLCQSVVNNVQMQRFAPGKVAEAKRCCLILEKAIIKCIAAIKACAGKANQAADSAIATGATRAEVTAAATAAVAQTSKEVVVESSTASVTPGGAIVPGPDAALVTTPVIEESVDTSALPPGVEVSPTAPGEMPASVTEALDEAQTAASGIPFWMKAAGVGVVAWWFFRRKGA